MNASYVSHNDKKLLEASKKGDEAAFGQLFKKYWDDLFRIAYRRLQSAEDAKDMVQDVFLSLWSNIDHISVEDSLGAYLYTALRNKIFNHLGKNNNRLSILMQQPFVTGEQEESIFDNYCTKELQHIISRQVAAMPEKMRQIYLLSKEEHLTNGEIATLLSLSAQTIRNQLYNALSRLKKNLINTHITIYVVCVNVFL